MRFFPNANLYGLKAIAPASIQFYAGERFPCGINQLIYLFRVIYLKITLT